jgi:hypothetical protein
LCFESQEGFDRELQIDQMSIDNSKEIWTLSDIVWLKKFDYKNSKQNWKSAKTQSIRVSECTNPEAPATSAIGGKSTKPQDFYSLNFPWSSSLERNLKLTKSD